MPKYTIKYLNENNELLNAYINPEPKMLNPKVETVKHTLHTICCGNGITFEDMKKCKAEVFDGDTKIKTIVIK